MVLLLLRSERWGKRSFQKYSNLGTARIWNQDLMAQYHRLYDLHHLKCQTKGKPTDKTFLRLNCVWNQNVFLENTNIFADIAFFEFIFKYNPYGTCDSGSENVLLNRNMLKKVFWKPECKNFKMLEAGNLKNRKSNIWIKIYLFGSCAVTCLILHGWYLVKIYTRSKTMLVKEFIFSALYIKIIFIKRNFTWYDELGLPK